MNDLERYFESNDNNLIVKLSHYFEIYEQHFSRFRGSDVHILEIGVYQGGSLQMWRQYFGPHAKIIGVDIDPRMKALEEQQVEIRIGDQESPEFLAEIIDEFPRIDIVIDDGGHTMSQQRVSFESLFPHVSDSGIYLCEDTCTSYWTEYGGGLKDKGTFIDYSRDCIDQLHGHHKRGNSPGFGVSEYTRSIDSISYYDSVIVFEKKARRKPEMVYTGTPSF